MKLQKNITNYYQKIFKKIKNIKNPYYKKIRNKNLKKIRDNLNKNKLDIMVDTYSKFKSEYSTDLSSKDKLQRLNRFKI